MNRLVAKLTAPKKFELVEEKMPTPGEKEILVKNRCVGLCHSDLPPYLGLGCTGLNKHGYHVMLTEVPYPIVLGHEPLGTVMAVGKGITAFKEGDTVSGMIPQTFASHFVTTVEATIKVNPRPEGYGLAEPLMCIANIARVAQPEFGDRVAVIGCGSMGLLTIMALKSAGLRELVAIDLQDHRLEQAKKYGATKVINPTRENVEDTAYEYTDGDMFDVVVEISGSLRGLDTALSIIRLADRVGPKGRGKILLTSVYGKEEKWSVKTSWNMMLRAPVMHVTHPRYCMDLVETMRRGVDMYEKGILKMDELITHRIPFTEIARGFDLLEKNDPSFLKGVVVFDS